MQKHNLPHYNGSLTIDGNTYQVSARITKGPKAAEQVPVHSHSQYELLAFYDGSTNIQMGNHSLLLKSGQCCLLRPHTYHLRRCSGDTTKYFTLFVQGPDHSPLSELKEPYHILRCSPDILAWFSLLEKELHNRDIGTDNNTSSLVSLILVAVLRELNGRQHVTTDQRRSLARYEDVIDDFFALRYAEDVRASDLAEQIGITTRHLARVMQHRYGCTFRQRLLEIRLYCAQEHLATTRLPISQIALRCGFTSDSVFSAAFRKKMGCTPTQYRSRYCP